MKSPGLEIEQKVRNILERKLRKSLSKLKLIVGYRYNGNPIYHEFDIVSDDKKIIGEVKSDRFTTENAYTTTRKWRLLGACFYLEKAEAEAKLLVLTDEPPYKRFKEDMNGLMNPNIKIMYLSIE